MHLVTLGQLAELGAELDVVQWDSTGAAQPDASAVINRGCPVGYFAQLVAPGTSGAIPYGNPNAWVRCRLIATSNAATIRRESGSSFAETVDIFTSASEKTARELWEKSQKGLSWGTGALMTVALLIVGAYVLPWLPRPRAQR